MVRFVALAIFALIMCGLRYFATAVVDMGLVAWLGTLAAIMWVGVVIENREREIAGTPPYSFAEARELIIPLCVGAGLFALIFALA